MTTDSSEAKWDVMAVQQLFWKALQTKDISLFESLLAEDFVSRSPGQVNESRTQFIRTLTSFPAKILSVEAENVEVHLFGEIAALTGVQVSHLTFANESDVENRIAITNLFRRMSDGWLMVLAHTVELSTIS